VTTQRLRELFGAALDPAIFFAGSHGADWYILTDPRSRLGGAENEKLDLY
jgi:hypothetical protein